MQIKRVSTGLCKSEEVTMVSYDGGKHWKPYGEVLFDRHVALTKRSRRTTTSKFHTAAASSP